jgi:hypothetical protein
MSKCKTNCGSLSSVRGRVEMVQTGRLQTAVGIVFMGLQCSGCDFMDCGVPVVISWTAV